MGAPALAQPRPLLVGTMNLNVDLAAIALTVIAVVVFIALFNGWG